MSWGRFYAAAAGLALLTLLLFPIYWMLVRP